MYTSLIASNITIFTSNSPHLIGFSKNATEIEDRKLATFNECGTANEYTKLVNAHKSDSINIKKLTDEVKNLKDVNSKLEKDISLHQKREKYIELYPTAYKNMMKIKE